MSNVVHMLGLCPICRMSPDTVLSNLAKVSTSLCIQAINFGKI